MSNPRDLGRLAVLAGLLRDRKLDELRAARLQREATQGRLAALVAGPAEGLSPIATAQSALLYQRWVDGKRAEINLQLARDTAAWLDAQAAARSAFGRAQVMDVLQDRAALARRERR
jgi:hypothetical protein